jgi:YaiO family outer membrane protein
VSGGLSRPFRESGLSLVLLLGVALAPGSAAAGASDESPGAALPWLATAHYDFQSFSKDRGDWHTYWLALQRRFDGGARLSVEALRTHRFGTEDEAVAVGGSVRLWPRAYGEARLQITPSADVLPRTDAMVEVFQGFGTGWEASASYRHLDLPAADVHVTGLALAKYIGDDWYLRARVLVITTAGDADVTQGLTIRRYLGSLDTYVQIDGGLGREVVDVSAGLRVESRRVGYVGLRGQTFFSRHVGAALSGTYRNEEPGPVGLGAAAELLVRW